MFVIVYAIDWKWVVDVTTTPTYTMVKIWKGCIIPLLKFKPRSKKFGKKHPCKMTKFGKENQKMTPLYNKKTTVEKSWLVNHEDNN